MLYSVSDIDVQIRRMSKYKGMGLDFFELDDEQFESRFQSAINKELIYIAGKSREETTYRILNELRQKYPDRFTLIDALIAKEDEEIKTMYWSRNTRARISDHAGHQVFLWALNECEKYGTCDNYFELLYDVREKISIQELYDATVKISDMKGGIASSMTIYYIGEILKELQDAFITDDEKCAEIVSVEWLCRNILEWKQMRCLQKEMKNDPKIYADFVGIVYKAEDDESEDKEKCEVANAVYSAFDKARFCPAEKDGKVSYEVLKKWVEELKGLLIKQKQENLFGHLLGRLLAYSPIGADSYHPCEAVRKIIEEYDSDSLRALIS